MEKFRITIANYFDRECLVSEILYEEVQWAEISQETGELIIQFYSHPTKEYWEFSLEEAIEILNQAKTKLIESSNKERPVLFERTVNPEQVNQQAQEILEEILAHPQAEIFPNRFGGVDIFEPLGKGARYDGEKNFLGFLQSRDWNNV